MPVFCSAQPHSPRPRKPWWHTLSNKLRRISADPSVAVCDQHGFALALSRMDAAPVRSIQISQCKAYMAARIGVGTGAFAVRLRRHLYRLGKPTAELPAQGDWESLPTPFSAGSISSLSLRRQPTC
jgi:hypothetical protein